MLSQSTPKPGGAWGPLCGPAGMVRKETKEIETKMFESSGFIPVPSRLQCSEPSQEGKVSP